MSSLLERESDTAEVMVRPNELDIQYEPALMDIELGRWSGQNLDELAKIDPEWKAFVRNPTVGPEGVETFPQVQERAVAAVECWRNQESSGAYPTFVTPSNLTKFPIPSYTTL